MASAAQLAARPAVPRLPDGAYAVPDPQDPAVTTLWRVAYGELRPWPPRRRWAPRPPKADPGLTVEERRARRERWYAEVYWPWKLAVVEEIRRAPESAAALFERMVPEHERPDAWLSALLEGHPTREELDQVERRAEDEHRNRLRGVAALAAVGLPYRHIARALRVSPWTAWQWARRGAELWQEEGGPEALTAALAALPPLDDLQGPDGGPDVLQGAAGAVPPGGPRRGFHRVGGGPFRRRPGRPRGAAGGRRHGRAGRPPRRGRHGQYSPPSTSRIRAMTCGTFAISGGNLVLELGRADTTCSTVRPSARRRSASLSQAPVRSASPS